MKREWKSGDVAILYPACPPLPNSTEPVRAMREVFPSGHSSWLTATGYNWRDEDVADARQLVVIDPFDSLGRLAEPSLPFARVLNAEDCTYYRSPSGTWRRERDDLERPWDHIGAVSILSEGVTA